MAVIVIAEVQGRTGAGYNGMLEVLANRARQADGLVAWPNICVIRLIWR